MADQADVETALVALVAGGLYPAGVGSVAAVSPSVGMVVQVSRGWPDPQTLDAALASGASCVTVYPVAGMSRLTTRFAPVWQQATETVPTVTASVSGLAVTLGGTAAAANVVGIQYGSGRLLSGYSYRLAAGDTLAVAAAGLAAKIPAATSAGAVVTLPAGVVGLSAAVVCDQKARVELRRQAQEFRLICWCPTPEKRDTLAAAVDQIVAGMMDANGNLTEFLPLSDGTSARVTYRTGYTMDTDQKDGLWRRDISYTVEYGTVLTQSQPEVLFYVQNIVAQAQTVTRIGVVDSP